MTTCTFSVLECQSGEDLISLFKRYAKAQLKNTRKGPTHPSQPPAKLSHVQDRLAKELGHHNWALLHKFLRPLHNWQTREVVTAAMSNTDLATFLEDHTTRTVDVLEAKQTMERWVRSNMSRLVDFAFHDAESPTGYGWPDEDVHDVLSSVFDGQYPDHLIEQVAIKLEVEDGPWGFEDVGGEELP